MAATDRDRMQVAAFGAFYTASRNMGESNDQSFANAVVKSSDDAFGKLPPDSLDKWLNFRKSRRQ